MTEEFEKGSVDQRPWSDAMKRALTCECGYEYDAIDDGEKCPRCAEIKELEQLTVEMLRDFQPRVLDTTEIQEAMNNGVYKYLGNN